MKSPSTLYRSSRGAALIAAMLLATSAVANAATYTSNIEARIKTPDRRLVKNAVVYVYNSHGTLIRKGYSSSRGVAKFKRIPTGRYTVYAYKGGVGTGYGVAEIRRGQGPARPTIYLRR